MKTFAEYSDIVWRFASYPQRGENLVYPALGLTGEAGEVAEKIKKLWRNQDHMDAAGLTPEKREQVISELGDVLWYINAMCHELDVPLEEVAAQNAAKLTDRAKRNVIKSEGDTR